MQSEHNYLGSISDHTLTRAIDMLSIECEWCGEKCLDVCIEACC